VDVGAALGTGGAVDTAEAGEASDEGATWGWAVWPPGVAVEPPASVLWVI
jgi:hypothetical protein